MFDFNALLESLPIMAKGMGGIFLVIFVIFIYVMIQTTVSKPKKDE